MRSTTLPVIATATFGMLLALPVSATVVTNCGPNLCYEYDDAQAAAAFYGLPSFAGDDAFFTPVVFEARSTDGVGLHTNTNTDFVDATWVFSRVYSVNPLNEIASILAFEEGDYEVNYAAGQVNADLYLRAFGLNAVEPTVVGTDSFGSLGNSGGIQSWSMLTFVNPSAALTQLANNLTVTIQNQLSAFTTDATAGSEVAWIEKKLVLQINTVVPVGTIIPVPAALWLFGSAFGLLSALRRRAT
ncbi:MAG: VPLPA-CTERM sorting domain-containing protein [Chromatiales bacterium]|nr:VPLPA-CTERM sorting domain-containing protein [Chromatiales bacterium]